MIHHRLKTSLAKALHFFPLFSGRLVTTTTSAHEPQLQSRVISEATIKPEPKVDSTIKAYLTPWDLQLMHHEYDQHGLLYLLNHPNNITSSSSFPMIHHRLKTSLAKALHFFPLFSGRLVTSATSAHEPPSSKSCFHVEFDKHTQGIGVLLIHASSPTTVSHLLDLFSCCAFESIEDLYPFRSARSHQGVFRPLLAVQVTQLVDGFFVGWAFNHMLVDGASFFHFFNAWADISLAGENGKVIVAPPRMPFHERERLTLELIGSREIYVDSKAPPKNSNGGSLMAKVFHFEKETLARLKERSNQEIKAKKTTTISSLQATIAHVWRSIIRCRYAMDESIINETTTFEIPMDARNRLSPPLPQEYFGTALFGASVTLKSSEILRNGLGWTALEIKKTVDSWNEPSRVKKLYADWIENPSFVRLDNLPRNRFVLISSPRLKIYGNDFGWGEALAFRSGKANSFDGRIVVSCGGIGQEGLTHVEMCLDSDTLSALEKDEEFMESVSSFDWKDVIRAT